MTPHPDALRDAAQAVLDRWDSPQWQWTKHGPTADLMAALRAALSAPADAVTGGSPDHMLQDQSRELSRWLSNQPDARLHAREAAGAIAAPADVPMHSHALTGPVAPLAGSVTDITAMSDIGHDQWWPADLPALPEPDYWSTRDDDTPLFTADQMHAYARAALAQPAPSVPPMTAATLARDAGVKALPILQRLSAACGAVTLNQCLTTDMIGAALSAPAAPEPTVPTLAQRQSGARAWMEAITDPDMSPTEKAAHVYAAMVAADTHPQEDRTHG